MTKEGWIKRRLNGHGVAWNKGLAMSDDYKEKNRLGHLGKRWSAETREKMKMRKGFLGKRHTEDTIAKIKEARKVQVGEKCPAWRGGVTPVTVAIRNSSKYKEWRLSVFERDAFTCQDCGKIGSYLHADHIRSFKENPELRFSIDNGRTLCVPCHFAKTFNKAMPRGSRWGHMPITA